MDRYRFLGWLALPFVFYLVPLILGFSWNALGQINPYNPPLPPTEGYAGRNSDLPITAEAWGAAVVNLPFRARLREYVSHHELPLWNPYQGLGQPFAAQGDGSPYFPVAIVRAFIPYAFANYVTFFLYYVSGMFLYLLLRGWDLSEGAAAFGGIAYVLSGALSVQIARPNLADQLCMVPLLFWGAARAMRERTAVSYAVLSAMSALNALAGFIQIAMLVGVVLVVFIVVYGAVVETPRPVRDVLTAIGALVLGNGLAAFELLPMIHAFRVAFSGHGPSIDLMPLPFANIVAFFFPLSLGYPLARSWLPGPLSWTVDWSDLFAYAGATLLLLCVLGWTITAWRSRVQRTMFVCFTVIGLVLILRYMSVPPFDVVNLLPALGQQTPKHANGIMVFCLVIAAAIALDHVHRWHRVRGRWLVLGTFAYFSLLTMRLLVPQSAGGGKALINPLSAGALPFLGITVVVSLLAVGVLRSANESASRFPAAARMLAVALVIGELSIYVPLGTSQVQFLWARLAIGMLVVAAGIAVLSDRKMLAGALSGIVVLGYAWVVAAPAAGLPRQFDADQPPPFMRWLRVAAGSNYRAFGIFPDFSSLGGIQDLGAVGPLAPHAFVNMEMAVYGRRYRESNVFSLAGRRNYPMAQYLRAKPVFDWLGVRYLVLDHVYFGRGGRTDDRVLLGAGRDFHVVYRGRRVTIVESPAAQPKAVFSSTVSTYRRQRDILAKIAGDPASILGPPMVKTSDVSSGAADARVRSARPVPVRLERYTPNRVRLSVDAPSSGMVVLKDAYTDGWSAILDGGPVPIVEVNDMVRGVVIPRAGHHVIRFLYRPWGFILGARLAAVAGLLAAVGVLVEVVTKRRGIPAWLRLAGGALAAAVVTVVLRVEL